MTHDDGFERVLKLEGKLLSDWVDDLRVFFQGSLSDGIRVGLDLSELSFADAAEVKPVTATTARRLGRTLLINRTVILSEAKHLWLFRFESNGPEEIRDSSLRSR